MDSTTAAPTTSAAPVADLLADARAALPDLVALRRRLHRIPEVGLQLPATQAVVVEELRALGLEPRRGTSTTSVTAVVEGARPGPTVLLRADMDGLPLLEETGLEFASETPGAMHACGHDTHMTMLLGAARLLAARREQLAGRVLLMFQPGEEGHHGARFMLEEGLLDRPAGEEVTGAFAFHIWTRYATGTVNYRRGPLLAAADFIRLTIRGRGGHASAPHEAVDPIPVAAEIVLALQAMVTRRVDVFEPTVVTIAHVRAGTTNNIIPETAFLEGTIRTTSEANRAAVHAGVRRVVEGICAAHGVAGELEIEPGYPVTINDSAFAEAAAEAAREVVGAEAVEEMPVPIMGAEDFSYVLQRVPGAMFFLGARPPEEDPATAPQNHSNRVRHHEPAMAVGAAVYAAVALRHLAG
ncbi:MAG: M20 family metallopeptidase [Chloroflexi bacterium]|jgi:hippurate hydrolase|nr:M20 family metallopeptidase [Chloroflexota bacterium]